MAPPCDSLHDECPAEADTGHRLFTVRKIIGDQLTEESLMSTWEAIPGQFMQRSVPCLAPALTRLDKISSPNAS